MALTKCSECGREISDKAPACPGCGAPQSAPADNLKSFIAGIVSRDSQSGAGAAAAIPERQAHSQAAPAPRKAISRRTGFIIIGVICAALWLKDYEPSDARSLTVGEDVLLTVSSGVVVVATNRSAHNELVRFLVAKDWLGVAELVASGQAFEVPNATRAKIIDRESGLVQVRVLQGDNMGRSGWVPSNMIECLSNCR